jgi:excisionase family DNA binding protein
MSLEKEKNYMNSTPDLKNTTGTWNHQQAAEYIGITPGTIRVWCSKRKVPFIKINGRVRFRQTDLDKFLDQNLNEPN